MSVKISANFEGIVKDFSDLKRHVRRNAEDGLDKALKISIAQLKAELLIIVNEKVKLSSEVGIDTNVPPQFDIPKSRNELLKFLFNEDLSKADFFKKSLSNNSVTDTSNIFSIKDKRIKIWQSLSDSSTFNGEESLVKARLLKGLIINAHNGSLFKLAPDDVKGLKLECSRDTGQTINSEQKFEAYKGSEKMTRNKDSSPAQRLAVWTVRQEDVAFMMRRAILVDDVLDQVLEGNIETAINLVNKTKGLNDIVEKLNDLREKKGLSPTLAVQQDLLTLIRNLSVNKIITKTATRYVLVSNYGNEADKDEKFAEQLRKQIGIWVLNNEDFWFKSMWESVVKALSKYDSKAKIL